jgi:hypothetical protein
MADRTRKEWADELRRRAEAKRSSAALPSVKGRAVGEWRLEDSAELDALADAIEVPLRALDIAATALEQHRAIQPDTAADYVRAALTEATAALRAERETTP